jgi:hypothetical protein
MNALRTEFAQKIGNVIFVGLALSLGAGLAPFCAQGQQIACGQTVTGNLTAAGQTNTYTFNANAGEVVTLLASSSVTNWNAMADIFSPSGSRIGGPTANNFTGPINLPVSGTYTVQVHADDYEAAGVYGISLTFLTGRCGTGLAWGPPISGTLNSLAEVDSYTFSGNAGESVTLNVQSTNYIATFFVAGPNGTILTNWYNGSSSLNLSSTGTYTVGIYSYYAGGTGPYSVSFLLTKLVPASYHMGIGATNGTATLMIWGQVGRATTLRYASDLSTTPEWSTLTNFNLPTSPFKLVDWSSLNSPRRSYQTVQ